MGLFAPLTEQAGIIIIIVFVLVIFTSLGSDFLHQKQVLIEVLIGYELLHQLSLLLFVLDLPLNLRKLHPSQLSSVPVS